VPAEGGGSDQAGGLFTTTRWSLVLAAGNTQGPDSRQALAELCEKYWYPLYAVVRHLEADSDRAQDLTQDFFVHILESRALKVAHPDRGRFRSYLTVALRNFLSKHRRSERARRRGGGMQHMTLDFETAESQYLLDAAAEAPDKAFDRRWAHAMMRAALERLREEMEPRRFRILEPFLTGRPAGTKYKAIGETLNLNEAAVRAAVRRMRQHFGKLLRSEVAETVQHPEQVDDELRFLLHAADSPQGAA
jgi:RNA polymerase sigma-70 factor (ECF subfamily)